MTEEIKITSYAPLIFFKKNTDTWRKLITRKHY